MSRKSVIARNEKRKSLIEKYAKRRDELKEALRHAYTAGDIAKVVELQAQYQKMPRDAAKVRHSNFCGETGRSRGCYKKFGLSRHVLRWAVMRGYVPGARKVE